MAEGPTGTTRLDRAILLLVTAYALVFLVRGAVLWPLGIDESWHLFYADVEPLTRAVREWATDSHPPFTYALMRPIVHLTADPFWGRAVSIVPALVQPWLLFAILRRLDVARPLAHVAVVAYTISHAYSAIGVVIRSYSLAATLGMAAGLAAMRLLPGRGAPERRNVVVVLAALAIGVASLYAAGLAALAIGVAILAVSLFDRSYVRDLVARVRSVSRRPEWIVFAASLAVVVAFYLVTYAGREFFHLDPWLREDGQGPIDFAVRGAAQDLADFTPLDVTGSRAAPIVVALVVLSLAWMAARSARRGRGPRGIPRAIVLLSVIALAAVFFGLGMLRIYPFGGEMRHQYPLFPLGLAALTLCLDDLYRALGRPALRVALCTCFVVVSTWTTVRSFEHTDPEFPGDVVWQPEAAAALDVDDGRPVCMPNVVFVALYGRYLHQDWHFVGLAEGFEVFETRRPQRTVYRHRRTWSLDPVPDEEFLAALHRLCVARGERAVRVCSPRVDPAPRPQREALADALAARCAAAGFDVVERAVLPSGEVYTLQTRR